MKNKRVPMRKCIGCMESKPKSELIRIAGFEGKVSPDPSGKAKGRGVYLCRDEACLRKAIKKKALSRSIGIKLSDDEMTEILHDALMQGEE